MASPLFIAFTGIDDAGLLPGMRTLSARYPVEWGVLIDPAKAGTPLFPDAATYNSILASGLRLAAHVCGPLAQEIVTYPDGARFNPAGFRRVQVNHGVDGASPDQVAATGRYARRHGIRAVLQCGGAFPADGQVDWLYDVSFGTGRQPDAWPILSAEASPFCGYSGGINPDNVADLLTALNPPTPADFWIDMESGVRREGRFDLARCEAVCRAVYG